jgi:hypothetical protein
MKFTCFNSNPAGLTNRAGCLALWLIWPNSVVGFCGLKLEPVEPVGFRSLSRIVGLLKYIVRLFQLHVRMAVEEINIPLDYKLSNPVNNRLFTHQVILVISLSSNLYSGSNMNDVILS